MKRISVVQQEEIKWVTPEVEDVPPRGTDKVSVEPVGRVIWDEGRPLDDCGSLASPKPTRRQARPHSLVRASSPVSGLMVI